MKQLTSSTAYISLQLQIQTPGNKYQKTASITKLCNSNVSALTCYGTALQHQTWSLTQLEESFHSEWSR